MLCSKCKKNPAILFFEKNDGKGEDKKLEGLCYNCAKKQGIDPLETLYRQNDVLAHDPVSMEEMRKQFESMFKDFAENVSLDDINKIDGAFTFGTDDLNDDDLNDEDKPHIAGAAIPLGSIFSSLLNDDNDFGSPSQEEMASQSNSRKKIKVEKKKNQKQNKKKKYLDTYGTNLTNKAKNGELDIVIGRDKEIQRIVQILNRRSKNNPCLIGEPGVGKTAIAQGLAIKIANHLNHQYQK